MKKRLFHSEIGNVEEEVCPLITRIKYRIIKVAEKEPPFTWKDDLWNKEI